MALGAALGAVATASVAAPWRRLLVAGGFPLSLAASGLAGTLPAWAWLLALALLAAAYPLRTWRDAPMFPTPARALAGLSSRVPLRDGARVLDAGCGLGHALHELRREYPTAQLTGLEWSWPLRLACAWRTPFAAVRRADIWRADWSGCDMVYLFQRPENIARAVAKARQELRPGAWLASLEFDDPALVPDVIHDCADGRRLWLYRAPFRSRDGGAPGQPRRALCRAS